METENDKLSTARIDSELIKSLRILKYAYGIETTNDLLNTIEIKCKFCRKNNKGINDYKKHIVQTHANALL